MKHHSLLAAALIGACATLSSAALAQAIPSTKSANPRISDVTDASAPVPPVVYQSVFASTPTGVEMESADWKKANAEVGQFKRGHVDILKWDEAQQNKAPMPAKPLEPDAAKPAAAPAPTSPQPTTPVTAPATAPSAATRSTPAAQSPSMHKH